MANTKPLTLNQLRNALSDSACAFRCRTMLQPAGGEGDKVFPPTYAEAAYAREQRRVPGRDEPVECVLLDSVQSQANRMEEALQAALDEGRLSIPVIEVDFSGADLLTAIGKVTSLQAPHRIADAILRDSLLEGKPFRQTDEGKGLNTVSLTNATALYRSCPTALIFGMWDSTGPKGGMGAKFQRAMVSEIVGIDAVYGVKTSSRIDPLQIRLDAGPLYRSQKENDIRWTLNESEAAKEKKVAAKFGKEGRPSEANHGNIVPSLSSVDRDGRPIAGGVTIASAEQLVTLSLPALRRLQFPLNGKADANVNAAGRTVLAALGLCAAALAAERGFDLRSRCLLWPAGTMEWELLGRPGEAPECFNLKTNDAIDILNQSVAAAEKLGLMWRKEPLVLKPSPQLVELVKKSQELSAATGGEEMGDE
jgi:CRISPR-associated protein Csb1